MAEFVMKKIVHERGLEGEFEISSAATSTEELGNPVYPPARRELAYHGIDCAGKYARQVKKSDYAYYDYIICADRYNLRNLAYIIGEDTENKVSLLLDYTDTPGESVADPWYTGDFTGTWDDILRGCEGLMKYLEGAKKRRFPM